MTRYWDSGSARIAYEVQGPAAGDRAQWVTLLNGLGRSRRDFRTLSRGLTAKGFGVLTLDNRGAGETVAKAPFTLGDLGKDTLGLWDALGIPQSHVAGFSLGGRIALWVALESPARVTSLVLVSTSPKVEREGRLDPVHRLGEFVSPAFRERHQLLLKAMAKEIARGKEGMARQSRALKGFDVTRRLSEISLPTLVLHGAEDRIFPLSVARAMAERLPDCQLEIVPGVGHLLLLEAPGVVSAVITRFLENRK